MLTYFLPLLWPPSFFWRSWQSFLKSSSLNILGSTFHLWCSAFPIQRFADLHITDTAECFGCLHFQWEPSRGHFLASPAMVLGLRSPHSAPSHESIGVWFVQQAPVAAGLIPDHTALTDFCLLLKSPGSDPALLVKLMGGGAHASQVVGGGACIPPMCFQFFPCFSNPSTHGALWGRRGSPMVLPRHAPQLFL